jgi:hypothetical protein
VRTLYHIWATGTGGSCFFADGGRETLQDSMGGIRPEFGTLFGPKKSIRAQENLFARDSALLRISPVARGGFSCFGGKEPERRTAWRSEMKFELTGDLVNGQQVITKRQADGTASSNSLRSARKSSVFRVLSATARRRASGRGLAERAYRREDPPGQFIGIVRRSEHQMRIV